MNIRSLTSWTLYRHRYLAGYVLLAVVTLIFLGLYINWLPGGVSPSEQQSAVASASITFNQMPAQVVDLPYHLLQKFSLEFLGVTPLGLRLPSMIFGALTALFMTLILRRWFPANIAFLAAGTIITSAWLISMARLGAPVIMVPFWTSLIILCATHISQQSRGWHSWKVILAASVALSLYTPFMAYFFAGVFIATLVQPHLRYLARETGALSITLGLLGFVLLLVPLGWGVYHNWAILGQLAALPSSLPEPAAFLRSIFDAANSLLNPFRPSIAESITPALTIVSAILLLMGAVRLLTDFHSVRAYLLLIWAAILIPVVAFNPTFLAVLFVPAMLVKAIGLNLLVRYWYRLFPLNPYARVFGALPLLLLMFSIIQLNYQRYFYGMAYDSGAGAIFKEDPFLAQNQLSKLAADSPATLVVSAQDKPLYQIMLKNRPNSKVVSAAEATAGPGTWIVANAERPQVGDKITNPPIKLLVGDRKDNSLRFWVYQL